MKGVFYDFFGMMIAGVCFLSGMYLVFIKELLLVAILLLAISFAVAIVVGCYDIVIEEDINKNRRKRNGNKKQDLGQRRVS